ncbi:unnamed protein product, partial [Effrenium voratum]
EAQLNEPRHLAANSSITPSFLLAEVEGLKQHNFDVQESMDTLWLCVCGFVASLMHAGFAMLETGACRARSASSVLLKNVMNMCVGSVGWWLCGWALAYGDQIYGFIGTSGFATSNFLQSSGSLIQPAKICEEPNCVSKMVMWFYQWIFCTTCVSIVSGGVAERARTASYLCYSFAMSALIYPGVVAWTWGGGWLSSFLGVGFTDFAGSAVVHLTGGMGALTGAIMLGPRRGRFEDPAAFEAHSLPLVVMGTLILWFGWFGFNAGSTLSLHDASTAALAAQVAVNTVMSGAVGGVTVFFLRLLQAGRYDVSGLCNGILAGLVSITAGCANMTSFSAVCVGALGGGVYCIFSSLLVKLQIDDPVDASAVHGACGVWGTMAAVLFDWGVPQGHFHGLRGWTCASAPNCEKGILGSALLAQLITVVAILGWVLSLSLIILISASLAGQIRVEQRTEEAGVDHTEHAQVAYDLDGK